MSYVAYLCGDNNQLYVNNWESPMIFLFQLNCEAKDNNVMVVPTDDFAIILHINFLQL